MDILLLAFNRLDLTMLCVEKLQSLALVKNVYMSIDGGRTKEEIEVGNQIEEYASNRLGDKLASVQRLDKNYGCRLGVEQGISWFFDNVESGVICEDDILIENNFLEFCQDVYNKHLFDKERICHISAYRPQLLPRSDYPVKSKTAFVWGWFTTRDAWRRHIDFIYSDNVINLYSKVDYFSVNKFNKKRVSDVGRVLNGDTDTWDWLWHLSMRYYDNYSIVPNSTLSRNIGSAYGAHAKRKLMIVDDVVVSPIRQRVRLTSGKEFDNAFLKRYYNGRLRTLLNELEYRVRKCFQI